MMVRLAARRWILLAAAAVCWLLLKPRFASPSERFYFALPPLALAWLFISPSGRTRNLRRTALAGVACLTVLMASAAIYAPAYGGWGVLWSPNVLPEVLACVYFFAAIILVVVVTQVCLRRLGGWLANHVVHPAKASAAARCGRVAIREGTALVLLIAIVVPYLLGALYVHRFKVPVGTNPRESLQRAFDDVEFSAADGVRLRGWFIPATAPASSRTMLFCHGLDVNRIQALDYVCVADAIHANMLAFDFRGHGDSDGHTISLGYWEGLDVEAGAHYVREDRPGQARQLIGLGCSMGSSALLRGASRLDPPFDALIIDSGFASAVELSDNVVGQFPASVRPLLTAPGIPLTSLEAGCWLPSVRPEDWIGTIRAPVFIIHGERDRMIPPSHALRLYERAAEPKELWMAPRIGSHNEALFRAQDEYLRRVTDFIEVKAKVGGGRRPAK